MIKLVLSDVDGTLIPLGVEGASQRTMDAIRALEGVGVRFGLTTGRDIVELSRLFGGDDIAYRTGILSNGKKILVDGEVRRLMLIDNDALARVVRVVDAYPGSFVTAYPLHTDVSNPIYCMGATELDIEEFSVRYAFNGILCDEVPNVEIIGATIACPQDQDVMDEILLRSAQVCPEFDFVQPAPHWSDIVPLGVNKGTALPVLLQALGITSDEVAVFGDAGNDLAIMQSVENAVAVSNATDEVKAASKWHIGDCADEAVAAALEDIARATVEGRTPEFMTGR